MPLFFRSAIHEKAVTTLLIKKHVLRHSAISQNLFPAKATIPSHKTDGTALNNFPLFDAKKRKTQKVAFPFLKSIWPLHFRQLFYRYKKPMDL